MTTPKAWWRREKKKLVHEVRSKAHRRLNTVVIVCVLIMVLYTRLGRAAASIEVAKTVPIVWKYLTLLAMFATIWYVNWRIERRTFDSSHSKLESGWLVWLAIVAFGFAVMSADERTLFHIGTFACLILCWVSDRYYKRKHERLEHGKPRLTDLSMHVVLLLLLTYGLGSWTGFSDAQERPRVIVDMDTADSQQPSGKAEYEPCFTKQNPVPGKVK